MKVALLAEGSYPFVTGGVSTWCDQLIRGLHEHEYDVVAVAGSSREKAAFEMAPNVSDLRIVALWDLASSSRREPTGVEEEAFLDLYRPFLHTALSTQAEQGAFTRALRQLFDFAQSRDLTAALQTDSSIAALSEVWADLHPSDPMTMLDAVQATELIEHFLRPLSAPVVRADLCHTVSNGLPMLLALAAKWTYGTPVIMSEHGVYLRERYLAFRDIRYRWPVKTVVLALFRRLCATGYAAADAIAPVNLYNQRWETRHGADPDAIETAFNGILADDFQPAGAEPEVRTVGWVGRIDPLKDLETLIKSFALVHAQVPDAVLRLFGPTPPGNARYEQRLRDLAADLDIEAQVRFEGPIRPVTRAYEQSTVVALSSISEGLPYTVMEAMMCGRSTVSTDVGGIPELVGDAGMLVPPRDPKAFAEACVTLLTDDARRHDMSEQARARALNLFQLGQMLETFRGLYSRATAASLAPADTGLELVTAS
ncbi:GT4 family glycosyltransferase PelF [Demequina sp. NBRC 110056]|uniref:GT4 family glycosyltransferase PelF n=1 Tax=Demequina sp. NBRC 110056 TaxID=1570345 RepID=UPI00117EA5E0|nr:GT4 family glycosyltransferase PelF [Demequina sp. NBRC 110056]